jgi:hypothetical protein
MKPFGPGDVPRAVSARDSRPSAATRVPTRCLSVLTRGLESLSGHPQNYFVRLGINGGGDDLIGDGDIA